VALLIRQRALGRLKARARQNPLAKDVALPVQELIRIEQTAALPLLLGTMAALLWANSPWSSVYTAFWSTTLSFDLGIVAYENDLTHWVNDLFMPIFFFVIGLEIKREIAHGKLRKPRLAALPIACAIGGVAVPVALYFAIAAGTPGASGWGVAVATDIAFALAVLRLAGDRIPGELATLILAFAIVDDVIGVLVIAIFYSADISLVPLGVLAALLGLVVACRWLGIWSLTVYLLLGAASWLAIIESGVHPTILGVALGLLTPTAPLFRRAEATSLVAHVARRLEEVESRRSAADRDSAEFERLEEKEETIFGYLETAVAGSEAPAERMIRWLNPWAGLVVLPIFALANAGIDLSIASFAAAAETRSAWATVIALVAGKPVGIALFGALAIAAGVARLPRVLTLQHIVAIGVLGGIGFTVSLFIADLALVGGDLGAIKLAILVASLVAGGGGYVFLRWVAARPRRSRGTNVARK
jgi:NhaA family Na+:H+ antiporter